MTQSNKDSANAPGTIIEGTPDNDFLHGGSGDDALLGYEGNDVLHGQGGGDTLWGHEGNDVLYGENGTDLLMGGADDDRLYGGNNNDVLIGDDGDDQLYGEGGDDTLGGGAGNDVLGGGTGSDTYVFSIGGGEDIIFNDDATDSTDVLLLGANGEGLGTSDVTLSRHGDTLTVSINGTSDRISVFNHFYNSSESISYIEFKDGTRWYWHDILANVVATEGDDTLVGTINDDVLNGLGGNDELHGDYGDDILDGGAGNDQLSGNFGNDTYLFGIGSGKDTIYEIVETETETHERVVLGDGITADDISVRRTGDSAVLTINGTDDQLTITNQFITGYPTIDAIEFADGTVWDADDILARVEITEFDDTIFGTDGDDVLNGLGGNDSIVGYAGNDRLIGGSGNDNLFGDDGNDALIGNTGTDSLYAGGGNDKLTGGADNDLLAAGDGNDTLDGGADNDWLIGGNGNDTYVFGIGSGMDMIQNNDVNNDFDKIVLGECITADNVTVFASGYDMVFQVNGTDDQFVVSYYFFGGGNAIDSIWFADGTRWGAARINAQMLNGTAGDDTISGSHADDVMLGFSGNDTIHGYAGNDVLHGDAGRDVLHGMAGYDTFVFDTALGGGNVDTLIYYRPDYDAIQLDNAIFTQLGGAGALNADYFASNAGGIAQDADDYILYDSVYGKLYYDADGNGAGAKVQFAVIGGRAGMTADEFHVI